MRPIAAVTLILGLTTALLIATTDPKPVESTVPGYNGKIAFVRGGDIWVVNPDGSQPSNLTNSAGIESSPSWSPDGDRIAFSSTTSSVMDEDDAIWIMSADGSGRRQLTSGPSDHQPAWSPDGSQIAFNGFRDGGSGIYLADVGSGDVTLLLPVEQAGGIFGAPAWSPDGTRIVYSDNSGLNVVNADAPDPKQIVPETDLLPPLYPSWSPDGNGIAYSDKGDIFLVNPDGSNNKNLTDSYEGPLEEWPSWSPDGELIAFHGAPVGQVYQIMLMAADGGGRTPITTGDEHASQPDWQTLPKRPSDASPSPGGLPDTGGPPPAGASRDLPLAPIAIGITLIVVTAFAARRIRPS